jgi:hypothetical protein
MFRQVVRGTALTTAEADAYFGRIHGESFSDDVTFLSTLRALVAPRMQEGEKVCVRFINSSYEERSVQGAGSDAVVRAVYNAQYFNDGSVTIHDFRGRKEDVRANFEVIESSFCDVYQGWQRLEKVTDFFRRTFYCVCFVNPERRRVVIFTDPLNMQKMHYLQCAIFAFMPWYFNPEDGVKTEEMELIQSLRGKDVDEYLKCIAKIASQYDFRSDYIRKALAGFEANFEKREREEEKDKIRDLMLDIERFQNKLADTLRIKRNHEIKLLGLETKIAQSTEGDSEIMEYFLCNRNLSLRDVTENILCFVAKGYVTYYDEDMAKAMVDNENSYVYRLRGYDCNSRIEKQDMKRLMYAIFIDQTLKLKFCAAYKFEFGVRVYAISGYEYNEEFSDCMPNPHIDEYSCMGDYERTMNECIGSSDYIGALEQGVASCKSLNFGDSTVMQEFMKRMYGFGDRPYHCIELPDGQIVTPEEAIRWMKKEDRIQEEDAKAGVDETQKRGGSGDE